MVNSSNVQTYQLNKLAWKNFSLQSNYHTYDIQHQQIKFASGVVFNIPRILLEAKDVTINNDSILILTKEHKLQNIFTENQKYVNNKDIISNTALYILKHQPEYTTNNILVQKGITSLQKNIVQEEKYISFYISFNDNKVNLKDEPLFNNTSIFNLKFDSDYVTICNLNNEYLIDRGSFFHLSPKTTPFNQKFNYYLTEDGIVLFKFNSNFTQVLDFSFDTGSLVYKTINSISEIPRTSFLYIKQLKDKLHFNSINESFIAQYTTTPLSASNSLEPDSKIKDYEYLQNYLVNIPIKSSLQENSIAYITSLKNYQTSTYNYLIKESSLTNREYTNIFTGTNQAHGYGDIYLNFTSSTLEKTFLTDSETIFHYPATAPSVGIPLSASGLVEEGAIAGKNPFTSDRIMLARKDYRELNIPTLSAIIADNTWLYSWLSAGNGDSIWVDRFYTGAKYDITDTEYLLYTVNDPLIIDVPSTMRLLPNRVYKYFHQGPKTIKSYIDQFSYISEDGSTKLLEITDWSSNTLKDNSIHQNNGLISLNASDLTADYFYLDGKSFAQFPATLSLQESRELYVGFWLKVNNWSEIEGSQIIGNYTDSGVTAGGYGLFNKQATPTSFISLIDLNHNYLYNLNSNFKVTSEQALLESSSITKPIYIVRTTDQNYWLINSNNLTAGKYDLNNNLLFSLTSLLPLKNITQVEADDIERIYVLDNTTNKMIIFDGSTGVVVTPKGIDFKYKRFELASNYKKIPTENVILPSTTSSRINDRQSRTVILGVDGEHSTLDNKNNTWYSVGVNLYKNKSLYAYIGHINYITCDKYNNIWLLHDLNKLTKINGTSNLIEFTKTYSSTIFDNSTSQQKRFINFISVKENNKETDYTIIIDNQEKTCYLIKSNGDIHNKINLLIIPTAFLAKQNFNRNNISFAGYGDFTGYQFQRKYNNKLELVWKAKLSQESGLTSNESQTAISSFTVYLPFSTAVLDDGWHYFSFCFSHKDGQVSAYVDSILMNSYKFDPFKYKIKQSYKPLSIGAVTTDQGILNDSIGIDDKHKLIAYITNLHIYRYAFNIADISLLYKSTFANLYKDLTWNINLGKRNYIEQIDKFFMHKLPGNKSKVFNIKIKNFNASTKQKEIIEQSLSNAIEKIIPADTTLNEIKWE